MANVIIILIIIFMMGIGIRHMYRMIRYGSSCCGSGEVMEKKIRVKDRNRTHYPFSYRIKVDGMVCGGCARRVENIFNSNDGLWGRVDLERKEVTILSKREMRAEELERMLSGTPYTVREVVS